MAKLTITLETSKTDRRGINNILAHLEKDIFNFIKDRREDEVTISSTRYNANYRCKVQLEQEGDHIGEPIPNTCV